MLNSGSKNSKISSRFDIFNYDLPFPNNNIDATTADTVLAIVIMKYFNGVCLSVLESVEFVTKYIKHTGE